MEQGGSESFLREELDAFDKIYSELLGIASSDRDTEEKKKMAAELRRRSRILASQSLDSAEQQLNKSCQLMASHTQSKSCDGESRPSNDRVVELTGCSDCRANRQTPSSTKTGRQSPLISPQSSVVADLEADIEDLSFIASGQQYDTGDKLFLDLLDDLDNISGNTPSARRRRRARDLFSEWLFSQEPIEEEASPQKSKDSFSDYIEQFDADFFSAINPKPLRHRKLHTRWRPKSRLFNFHSEQIVSESTVWFRRPLGMYDSFESLSHTIDLQTSEALAKVSAAIVDDRPIVADDLQHLEEYDPTSASYCTLSDVTLSPCWKYLVEDDADSGYHTGESTVQATPVAAPRVPSERTLTREDLRRRIESFNKNQHGLLMTLHEDTLTFQGFIRVHMNLMRPISMTLPMRPPSIYDVIGSDGESEDGEGGEEDTLTTSFYLPKDTTKVIHITRDTTTSEVIKALLQKFKITDNPRKFALYEKIMEGDRSIMRRMTEDERPLPLCLSWSCEGLETRRFILQENDTGEIIWDEFSIPELENFLRILDREEEEYVEQVKARYTLLRIQMQKEMQAIEEEKRDKELFDKPEDKPPDPSSKDNNSDKTLQEDKREPVFV